MSRKPEAPLPGWPGHRTRPGRSGYDPLDTNREAAHMQGTFIRRMLTGQLRTRNPFYLAALGAGGLGFLLPLLCSLVEILDQRALSPSLLCSLPLLIAAVFFLFNFGVNIRRRR